MKIKKYLNLRQLERNSGSYFSSLDGCLCYRLPKGEKVMARKNTSPNNSYAGAPGFMSEIITTNKRTISVRWNYMTGETDICEVAL